MSYCGNWVLQDVVRRFTEGSPADVLLPDCARLNELELTGALATACTPRLQLLMLGYCGRGLSDAAVNATLGQSDNCVPNLRELKLHGAYRLTDKGLAAMLRGAPSLTALALTFAPKITTVGLASVCKELACSLRSLTLDGCNGLGEPEQLLRPLQSLMSVERLSLKDVPNVTDAVVSGIADAWGDALLEIDLSGTPVTDQGIAALAKSCLNLRRCVSCFPFERRFGDVVNVSPADDSLYSRQTSHHARRLSAACGWWTWMG